MDTPTIDIDAALETLSATTGAPRCECEHNNPAGVTRCPHPAQVRVTVACTVDGCDDAARVLLLCRDCSVSWRRQARGKGLKLRVRPL